MYYAKPKRAKVQSFNTWGGAGGGRVAIPVRAVRPDRRRQVVSPETIRLRNAWRAMGRNVAPRPVGGGVVRRVRFTRPTAGLRGLDIYGQYDGLGRFRLRKVVRQVGKGLRQVARVAAPIAAGFIAPGIANAIASRPSAAAPAGFNWNDVLDAGRRVLEGVIRPNNPAPAPAPAPAPVPGPSVTISPAARRALVIGGVIVAGYLLLRR